LAWSRDGLLGSEKAVQTYSLYLGLPSDILIKMVDDVFVTNECSSLAHMVNKIRVEFNLEGRFHFLLFGSFHWGFEG